MNEQDLTELKQLVAGGDGIIEHLVGDYKAVRWSFWDDFTGVDVPRARQVERFIIERGGTVVATCSYVCSPQMAKTRSGVYRGYVLFKANSKE